MSYSILEAMAGWSHEDPCFHLSVGWDQESDLFVARFVHGYSVDIRKGCGILGIWGRGKTVELAATSYARQIAGKTLYLPRVELPQKDRTCPIYVVG